MLPASLAAELEITQEEMDLFAEDMCSVCPGCTRVQSTTAAVRSVIVHICYSSAVEGHELENIWWRMHHLDQAMNRFKKLLGGDKTPPELGSPKDNVMVVINMSLDMLTYILSALDTYGFRSMPDTQHQLLIFRHQLDSILDIIARIIKAVVSLLEAEVPLLKAEDCHEGIGLPSDPSSSPSHRRQERGRR